MLKKLFNKTNHNYPLMRCPERSPKCYELTDQERKDAIMRQNRNVWNTPENHLERQ